MIKNNASLPLFPLNVVLFPGMMLPLHIFEDRYKSLIKDCLANGKPFGVVLAKNGTVMEKEDEDTFSEFYSIGTTAKITAVEHLKDGRMNLITVGQDRFVIKDFYPSTENFLVGQVAPFPMQNSTNQERTQRMTVVLRGIVERYIGHLAEASGEDLSNAKIPDDSLALAFLAATAIQGPSWSNESDKQMLLSMKSLQSLIAKTIHILDKEDKILAYTLKAHKVHERVERLPFIDYSLN